MELVPKIMAGTLFALGMVTAVFGLITIMAKEYQQALRMLSSHSTKLSGRAITEEGMGPALEGMARLLDAIRNLVATAVGVGTFLVLIGVGMVVLAFWMFSSP
ncbi:MAG: hypothetical protein HYU86_11700 [Chloroflexi bacterium]|nr:hypothetical protein [Chloroflexota bacterium]